jgi:hypothetical protein
LFRTIVPVKPKRLPASRAAILRNQERNWKNIAQTHLVDQDCRQRAHPGAGRYPSEMKCSKRIGIFTLPALIAAEFRGEATND